MNDAEAFYPELHKKDATYSAGEYHMESFFSLGVLGDWAKRHSQKTVRMLDVGCGKGLFMADTATAFRQRWGVKETPGTGIDLVRSPGDQFARVSPNFKFVQQNLDNQTLPFPDKSFDFVSCNHVLEHVFQTEKLVKEIRRVTADDGLAVISVPNLAAWVNRVFFLFAGQPLGTELGTEKVTYGFWPEFLQHKLEKFPPSGHIRDFTPRGLRDLTTHCGFQTVGWWKQSKDPISRLGKWAGRGLAIVMKPA